MLIAYSFNASKYGTRWGGWTLGWYRSLLDNSLLMGAAGHSMVIAVLSASLATIIGTLGAVCLYRYRFFGRQAMQGLLFVSMMTPDIVMAISLLALFVVLHIRNNFV